LATEQPDAVVVLDDFMACGVVLAARQLHVRVPDQLALVGFNNSSLCNLLDVGLTSVSLGLEQIVQTAVCKLLDVIQGDESAEPVRQIVPCELVVRGSSQRQRVPAL
jgi:DNA-binding LacI/PurR family transcriptional regulator